MILLAKGKRNGGTLLKDHLRHVAELAKAIAKGYGVDVTEQEIAFLAGILHDIGKAHTKFQERLRNDEKRELIINVPLRHEISSLLFLPAFPREHWDALIEYVIAHHKSVKAILDERNPKDCTTFSMGTVMMRFSKRIVKGGKRGLCLH